MSAPIRCGDQVRYRDEWLKARNLPLYGAVGTVAWVDRTSPNTTLVHVVWIGGGASRVNINNLERVEP